MRWVILGREIRALDATNRSGLWMTRATLDHELKVMDAMNNLEVLMI